MIREYTSDCVHCGFCLPTCPTYVLWREEMDSPRGRIHLMDARLDGTIALNATVAQHFDRCLGCMACLSSCPSGVRYDRLIESTRAAVEEELERPLGDRLVRGLLFRLLPLPRPDARRAPARAARPCRPDAEALPAPRRDRAALARPGRGSARHARVGRARAASGSSPAASRARSSPTSTPRPRASSPPTASRSSLRPRAAAARSPSTRAGSRRARSSRDGSSTRSTTSTSSSSTRPGCGSHLKELGWLLGDERAEAFAAEGARRRRAARARRRRARAPPASAAKVALQDSCHLRHAQRLPLSSRTSLARIPGLEVVEPAEQDLCCGSAGIYNVTQPEAARELGERKAAHVLATGAQAYASANPGCLVQVSNALRRAKRPLPALHPIELVDASIRNIGAGRLLAGARR